MQHAYLAAHVFAGVFGDLLLHYTPVTLTGLMYISAVRCVDSYVLCMCVCVPADDCITIMTIVCLRSVCVACVVALFTFRPPSPSHSHSDTLHDDDEDDAVATSMIVDDSTHVTVTSLWLRLMKQPLYCVMLAWWILGSVVYQVRCCMQHYLCGCASGVSNTCVYKYV